MVRPDNYRWLCFWPWLNKIEEYSTMLQLTPLQTLQLYESHTTGDPHRMISYTLSSTGRVTSEDVAEVYNTLIRRYGAPQRISRDILAKIDKFPSIRNPNTGDKLEELYDLCKVVPNTSQCPESRPPIVFQAKFIK